jgi:hypothetical protein
MAVTREEATPGEAVTLAAECAQVGRMDLHMDLHMDLLGGLRTELRCLLK